MGLSYDDVLQILKLVDESRCAELEIEVGDLKLHVIRAHPSAADGRSSSTDRAAASRAAAGAAGAGDAPESVAPSPQGAGRRFATAQVPVSPGVAVRPQTVLRAPASNPEAPPETAPGADADLAAEVAVEGAVAVRAPMVGTFYRCPSPESPPFVEEGEAVAAADTVGIVEVMKLMSPIKAGTAGRVVLVCAQDAQIVEYGEVLMWIQPTDAR